jgi:exodeoxyribonuclease VII small subunit
MDKKKGKIAKLSFEEALAMLENIIKKMEMEELPLEESLNYFQEGMELNAHCRKLLTEAELRVEKLLQSGEWEKYDEYL